MNGVAPENCRYENMKLSIDMNMNSFEEMMRSEQQLCPWGLSKKLIALGFKSQSVHVWVHPWVSKRFIEDKRKCILIEWYNIGNRGYYPAYTVTEIMNELPDEYILGKSDNNNWYCKSSLDGWSDINYYKTAILACANALINLLKISNNKDKRQ